jgi:hypothetical protein
MKKMVGMQILYLAIILGSLAFGLQSLAIGMGGKLPIFYRRGRAKALALAASIGLTISGLSIFTSHFLNLNPLFLFATVGIYTIIVGKLTCGLKKVLIEPTHLPEIQTNDADIEKMLDSRGFKKFLKKEVKDEVKLSG